MKKHILLSVFLGLGLLLFTNPVKSQNFQIVASFGTAHNWAVPNAVLFEIDYYYPYHQIVHINRERRGRNLFYNVLLERRGQFVELYFGRHAMILDINYYNSYPLAQHICSAHCGYHGNFYRSNREVCNHAHGNHRGHNHIAYRSNSNPNSYAARNSAVNRNVSATPASHYNKRVKSNRNSNTSVAVNRNTNSRNSVARSSSKRSSVGYSNNRNNSNRINNSDERNKATVDRGRSSSVKNRTTESRASSSSRSRN